MTNAADRPTHVGFVASLVKTASQVSPGESNSFSVFRDIYICRMCRMRFLLRRRTLISLGMTGKNFLFSFQSYLSHFPSPSYSLIQTLLNVYQRTDGNGRHGGPTGCGLRQPREGVPETWDAGPADVHRNSKSIAGLRWPPMVPARSRISPPPPPFGSPPLIATTFRP